MKSRLPTSPKPDPRGRSIQIVGVGASAGGLDAFTRFFKAMPGDAGLAFVLIQHIDPDHESHMAQLLSKHTAMRVVEASDEKKIEADTVYIIPPNRSMSIKNGTLHLTMPVQRRGLRTPIDYFFSSLADDQGEKSVCILMSSTGTDGVLGLRAVKAAGGMVMVQDPANAQYGDMPRSAIATGLVDYVLSVELMPKTLLGYVSHSYISGGAAVRPGTSDADAGLAAIQSLLRSRTTHDFRYYKRGTLVRRIERRMGLNQVQGLKDYLALLRKKPGEVVNLAKDLMIGVTSFFRDPEAFEELKTKVIPSLVRSREPDAPIRVWVPGCATGEEAYSLTMLILEELAALDRSNKVQVFATDIDEDALQFARISHYPESIAESVGSQRLKRFFTATEHGFIVQKPLRECVVFAVQNLITSPPFSKIDLLSCRNVAIYLESEIQKKLVELFHFAINPGGCLFLGSSEGIANRDDLFRPVSKKWRLYRRLGAGRREVATLPILSPELSLRRTGDASARIAPPVNLNEIDHRLMEEFHPSASVLTDRKGRILHLSGPANRYLELPVGEPSLDLHVVAREGLRSRLRTAIQTVAREERRTVLEREHVKRDSSIIPVKITMSPVKSPPAAEGLIHIVFEELALPPLPVKSAESPATTHDEKDAALRQIENELKSTQDDLQGTIEDLETSNEELKVANEEVLSSNEELQSTNEELETSKEELQSLNEELSTLNSQLQEKLQDLAESANDLANLLSSADIATVFLDTKFRVKRFTAPVAKLLNLIPTDVGRPIRHMVQNLVGVNILNDATAVLRKLIPIQRQVQSKAGSWYVMRVLPYRTTENVIEGIVITFSDVSDLIMREAKLHERERQLRIGADLAHKALARMPLERLLALATRQLVESLDADLCDLLKPDETGNRLIPWAGTGWNEKHFGTAHVPAAGPSQPAQAFRQRGIVSLEPSLGSKRPLPTPLQRIERVKSALYVGLGDAGGPIGVLGIHSRRKRTFSEDEGRFLQDIAAVLSNAVVRDRVEAELKAASRLHEARLRERTLWLAASHEVSRAANRADNVAEVMHRALVALCTSSGWKLGHVYLSSKRSPTAPEFQSAHYPKGSERFRPFEQISRSRRLDGPLALPSIVLRKGSPVWVSTASPFGSEGAKGRDAWTLPLLISKLGPPRGTSARRLGLQSAAAVPIKVGFEVAGVLEVFSDLVIPPNRPMLDMMEQVAFEIGRSVERMQAQERVAAALWGEQRSIAQELHDSIGQELTGLGAMSESLLATLHRQGRIDATRLKRLTHGLQVTLEKLRSVTHGLLPLEVEADGLGSALSRLARQSQSRFGLKCLYKGRSAVQVRDRDTATHLYRIAQESITNAVRHSRAKRIVIGLKQTRHEVVLSIRDNGRGMARGASAQDGIGLRIMRHRAKAIGGRLSIRGGPSRGTTITCTVPGDGTPPRPIEIE